MGLEPPGLILVIDLSASLYIALLDSEARLLAFRIRDQGTRGEAAHGLLDECLAEAGAQPGDLASICIGTGPGSFTGIRVGVAMAQGLAFARRLPLYPYSSLAAMAICYPIGAGAGTVPVNDLSPAVAAIAANGGQYFLRQGTPAIEALVSGQAWLGQDNSQRVLVTSGRTPDWERFPQLFAQVARMEEIADFPRIARLARSGPPILDGGIRPNYLQVSAAEAKRLNSGSGEPA